MDVWEFEKTFETRLNEYRDVFDGFDQNSSIVGFSSIWAAYLSDVLQQHSWMGVWSPSHKECFELDLHASLDTNVSVNEIGYDNLTAYVTVHPEELYSRGLSNASIEIPLKDLYVAKRQNNDEVDFEAIAKSLDVFRIFYHYLIFPWDEDVEDGFVSFLTKLEDRLSLYYDIVNGALSRVTQKDFIALVSRGRKIYEQMRMLTLELADSDEKLNVSMDLFNNLKLIQNRLHRYENTKMRKYENFVIQIRKSCLGCQIILPKSCNISSAIQIFGRVEKILPQAIHKGISRCLNDFLGRYSSGETIIIPSSIHCLDSQRLDWNVTLLGLAEDERPVFKDRTPYWYFFKITGDNVIIRNLVVEMRLCHTAIFISEGVTELDSVIMKVERSIKSVAIVVEYNASLVANRCRFVDFDVAIFCLPGSAVELTGCIFENNKTCVEIMPGAQVCMVNCDLSSSKNGCVKYNGGFDKDELKSLDSLSDFDTISFRSMKVPDESKAVLFV